MHTRTTDEKALRAATKSKQHENMMFLLEKGVGITSDILDQACQPGFEIEIDILMTNAKLSEVPMTPLIRSGNIKVVERLIKAGLSIPVTLDASNKVVGSALASATSFDMVSYLLKAGGNSIIQKNPQSEAVSGLVAAANRDSADIVNLLLNAGVDPETRNSHGETALLVVSRHLKLASEEIVRLLLAKGADVEAENAEGRTPLLEAVEHGTGKTVRLLLDAGAGMKPLKNGLTILHHAASMGNLVAVKGLLEAGADAKSTATTTMTSVVMVAVNGLSMSPEIVELLLNYGADPEDTNNAGKSALVESLRINKDVFETIIHHPLWAKHSWKNTITRAFFDFSEDMIVALVENGLDLTIQDEEGRSILDTAIRKRWLFIVRFLLEHDATAFGPFTSIDVAWVEVIREGINQSRKAQGKALAPSSWMAKRPPVEGSLFG